MNQDLDWRKLAQVALAIAALGALVLVAGPLGYRAGAVQLRPAFFLLKVGAWLSLAGAILGVVCRIKVRSQFAVFAMILGIGAFVVPFTYAMQAQRLPQIHDITTDFKDPPQFQALLEERARAQAPNPPEYGGPRVAQAQRASYPDIQPLLLPGAPAEVFARVLERVRESGWQVIHSDAGRGLVEAVATTVFWGFKDDVVIRVRPEGAGSRVDMRSVSRVGISDIGMNAKRIRKFLASLQ